MYSRLYHECGFVAFNSQLLNSALPEARTQWDWLAAELERLHTMQLAHIILLTHMPLFVHVPDERLDWNYWRNSYLVIGPPGRDYVLESIPKYGVTGYLCGHWHYPLQQTLHWTEGHTTSFVTCDAAGPASMAQQQFNLPPLAHRSLYRGHHAEREKF